MEGVDLSERDDAGEARLEEAEALRVISEYSDGRVRISFVTHIFMYKSFTSHTGTPRAPAQARVRTFVK